MASTTHALICAGLALLLYSCIGMPFAARVASRSLAPMLAPAIGWAVHSAAALPLFFLIGMSRLTVTGMFVLPFAASLVALWMSRARGQWRMPKGIPAVALLAAALLACTVAAAVLPKISSEGVALSAPIFDHSKVAMVDEMARLGVPPADPFFGGAGGPPHLSYYYLWHFSAAELSLFSGMTGWEADAGLAWFTAFASLALMIGFAVSVSGRATAALWVPLLAATASARPILEWLFGTDRTEAVAGEQSGFGGWLFQTSWATQHVASATASVLAIFLLIKLVERQSLSLLLIFALTMTACFESSTWIGGIVFPLAAVPVALIAFVRVPSDRQWSVLRYLAGAAVLAIVLISPFLYDQFRMTVLRGGAPAVVFARFPVLGDGITASIGRFANLPAYWLIFLVVEFPATYLIGIVSLFSLARSRDLTADNKAVLSAFSVLLFVSLCAAWLLMSTLGENNDLGWRAVVPGAIILIVLAAAGLSRLSWKPFSLALVPALALILLGAPDGVSIMSGNITGGLTESSKAFARTPALWQAVRHHTSATERVANNPLFMKAMTPWTGNISWALLANRRSCYAGANLVDPFSSLSQIRRDQINLLFQRVFAGDGDSDDVAQMATQFNCSVAVVTPQDGAWSRDPFAASPFYRLVEATPDWRIYRQVKLAQR